MTKQQRYLGFLAHVTCDTLQILLILCSDFEGLVQFFLVSNRWESWIQSIRNLICLKLSLGQLCNFNMGKKSLLTIYLRGLYGLQKVSCRVNYPTSYTNHYLSMISIYKKKVKIEWISIFQIKWKNHQNVLTVITKCVNDGKM